MFPNQPGRLEAVHHRHADVEQYERESLSQHACQGLFSGKRTNAPNADPLQDGFIGQ
jgi:hypothetical protein